ncbi:MAG: glycosyltransferase [Gammaproteobacteria bacterium]|nr:glycosyltransferase [Gammaproteobacteria bacterium]
MINSDNMRSLCESMGSQFIQLVGTPIYSGYLKRPATEHRGKIQQVIFAGRLAPEKNITEVINAAKRLPKIQFVIAGDGPLRTEIETAAGELTNLTYKQWLATEALITAIDNSDLLILPSSFESFGTVALEAMSRQRLAIVSAGCGIVDWPILRKQLAVIDQPAELGAAIEQIAKTESQVLQQQARQAQSAALDHHQQTLDCWHDVLTQYVSGQRAAA